MRSAQGLAMGVWVRGGGVRGEGGQQAGGYGQKVEQSRWFSPLALVCPTIDSVKANKP